MTAVKSGQYSGVPIVNLPTGYMVWCVENDKLKKHWQDFQTELVFRADRVSANEQAEPQWHESITTESWYENLDLDSQTRYKSMISTGAWHWNPKKPKHVDAMVRYNQVMIKLNELYPQADNDDSAFNKMFDAGTNEVRLATPEEIKAAWDKDPLNAKLKKQKLADILKKQEDDVVRLPRIEDNNGKVAQEIINNMNTTPKLTANDIIDRIRSKNSRTQQVMVFNSLLNQLTSVADLISEQEQHFDIYEMRDLEWHLNSVKNRIYWLLQQREDI